MERTNAWLAGLLIMGVLGCGQTEPAAEVTDEPTSERMPTAVANVDDEAFVELLHLAKAAARDGRTDLATQSFEQAIEESRRLNAPRLEAKALVAYGLYFDQLGRVEDAQDQLRSAVTASRKSNDAELLARCQLELGIFCQHQYQFAAAKELLAAAAHGLDPNSPEADIARGHLTAVKTNQACSCGAQGRALVDALRKQIISEAPPDLVSDVVIDFTPEAGFQVECDTRRKPTADEAAQLSRIVSQARSAYHQRVRPTALR